MASDRICVLVLHRDRLDNTLECLDSLANSAYPKFTCLVINHNPVDASALRLKHPNTLICDAKPNLGDAANFNVGIEWALTKPFSWILLLSHDVRVDPCLLTEFMKQTKAAPEAKIFGAKILRYEEPTQIEELGRTWNVDRAIYESIAKGELDEEQFTKSQVVVTVSMSALLMHRSVPETIGLLEPSYHGSWGDIDFCFRARRKKFLVRTAPLAKVWRKATIQSHDNLCLDHFFWWHGRLLWLSRNIPSPERRAIFQRIIRPEIRSAILVVLTNTLSRLFFRAIGDEEQLLRAGLKGAWHYYTRSG
jgi:hypothetical protein